MEVLLGLIPLLLPVIVIIIGRRVFYSRVKHNKPATEKALAELDRLKTPMHYFSEQEERAFRNHYSALSGYVNKKIVHSLFKRSSKEIAIFSQLVSSLSSLSELRCENNRIVRAVEEANRNLPIAQEEYAHIYSGKRYIAEHDKKRFLSHWKELHNNIKALDDEGLGVYLIEGWREFQVKYATAGPAKNRLNSFFMDEEQDRQDEYFNHLLKYPLDHQQREAIITMEDNCLVVSSAGSGKTSTIEGRVHYLVDKLNVDPKRILLVTYTNKAANSLTERLGIEDLKCYTFHKLASKIIAEKTGIKPSFADESLKRAAYDELKKENSFLRSINDYISNYQSATDEFDFNSKEDYFKSFGNRGNKAFFPDMRGRDIFTHSGQEKKICYYLSINGIDFLYENPYEYQTADIGHRQYLPDFTIFYTDAHGNRQHLYYEHFGIDRNGRTPKWFGDNVEGGWEAANAMYHDSIRWKRETHQKYGTLLMETTSADFDGNNFEEILLDKLQAYGVPIHPKTPQEIYSQIIAEDKGAEKEFARLLESFLSLMKSSFKTIDQIATDDINDRRLKRRFDFMLERIIRPYCIKYADLLAERGEIDFTDGIIKATEICLNSKESRFEHIIVDEFQDISLDRYRFIQSMRGLDPFTYLFCVGDDWQSVYRFAGSDMSLFKNFEKHFGFTKRCPIETTYRFGEPLISKASQFITQNPVQTVKHIRPASEDRYSDVSFYSYPENGIGRIAANIIDGIPTGESILLLGRYGWRVKDLASDGRFRVKYDDEKGAVFFKGRELQFLSVHKAKGLEADHVILLACDSGFYGFPSNIADDPILRLVLSEEDQYEYGEERRLFYVAMTRCKKKTYILYNEAFPSPFVGEFLPGIPEEEKCPLCRCGKKLVRMHGVARNGHPYIMYGCSNYRLGCEYKDFEWDNDTVVGFSMDNFTGSSEDDNLVPLDFIQEPY